MSTTYQPLPVTLHKNGFTYRLHLRCDNYAIYQQWMGEDLIAYEVFKIKRVPERKIKDKTLPAKERFPSDEDFGYSAKACTTLEKALKRYQELLDHGHFLD